MKATQLKVSKLLTLITRFCPSSPKMRFSFDITEVSLGTTFDLRSPSSGVDPSKALQASLLQNKIQEQDGATNSTLWLAQKELNQCRSICSEVGLAKSILSKL
jgi:hypothetical protein